MTMARIGITVLLYENKPCCERRTTGNTGNRKTDKRQKTVDRRRG